MARPKPLSGFPEWLPADRIVEQHVLDVLRHTFELHGFASVNTRALEPIEQLARKGEIEKEVYAVHRLQGGDATGKSELGLHFDLTVPFARYVLEHSGKLDFPFKRYQIQPVWRGERPQDGRYREFYQADIDVVGDMDLPFHFEVEVPLVIAEAFRELEKIGVPPIRIQANNRKLLEGFCRAIGLQDSVDDVLRCLDKLDKIGAEAVGGLLAAEAGADAEQRRLCLALAVIEGSDAGFAEEVRALGVSDPLMEEGLAELVALIEAAGRRVPGVVFAQLKIARGLDYYTGTVYETLLIGHEALGSVCSGGRYDNLASSGDHRYPGVGVSIGVTRLLSRLLGRQLVASSRSVPSAVLVAVDEEDSRAAADEIAAQLRRRDIPAEVSPTAARFGKQIRYADRRGIPFVWFHSAEGVHEVKDIRSGEQVPADPGAWMPPSADRWPTVARPAEGG